MEDLNEKNKCDWEGKEYSFFSNKNCEWFPCHKTDNTEDFNCLFCYCPLYTLAKECGGNYSYIGDIKDCSNCLVPHRRKSYGYILKKYPEIVELMKKNLKSNNKEN